MNKLRYSEMFYSIQGEGRYVGVPSVFLRVFGCNFECTGFGQDRDRSKWLPKDQMPHNKDYPDVKAIEDLPVPHVGCDSSFSWGKKWGYLAHYDDVDTIVDKINSFIPKTEPIHLVLTGGEPLLKGFQPAMSDIILHRKLELNNITFETNGTQEYHFKDLVNSGTNSPWSFAQKVEEEKNPYLSGGFVNMNKKTSWYNDRYGDRSSYIFSSYCIPNGITWSVDGLVNEYKDDCIILENGMIYSAKGMDGLEEIETKNLGKLEAFYTSGGASHTIESMKSKGVQNCSYKTLRYPGHRNIVKFLIKDCELNNETLEKIFVSGCGYVDRDEVIIIAKVHKDNKSWVEEKLIKSDDEFSAMQKATAFPISSVASIMAEGKLEGDKEQHKDHWLQYPKSLSYADVPFDEFNERLELLNE
jgi:organic radical activating enzyme